METLSELTQTLMLLHLKTSPPFESTVDILLNSSGQLDPQSPSNNDTTVPAATLTEAPTRLSPQTASMDLGGRAEIVTELRTIRGCCSILTEAATIHLNLEKQVEDMGLKNSKELKSDQVQAVLE